ncbi:DUF4268 domain-containing protein [Xanthomonas melonis]|uniref:DUF4268 domain-containing protein n=1 Tax=Xanthomonas melonis TaxID=56456 RepID=A0ABS8NW70_9XANT|nr:MULTISPECIES: DUF4268 domain-containing protein [Xanthomonas]MCC4588358.1 DUF4268 domain-containing protein [Xanthomonas sp. NCPPB 1067]MCD0245676.1 DUF4268 domain-containing protein [Xanthomonas melonis]MCD0258337.1 DUF4268 domain-containing protein [Xanthomonas melonis]MCD0266530.1 DUF4268 domain-containing protein [Xanthomonas melonis]
METQLDLGTIENVSLKNLWPGEATHFTPWLSQNLEVLGKKLGMDLQLESTETSVGDFSADIIARDLSSSKLIVIENQFGATDHKHLGQLITYASYLGAGVVVWIAESIRAEHKAAMDFLNLNLKESLSLYAIEASAIRINDSKPAFILSIVSRPNEASISGNDTAQSTSETQERYRTYFQTLIDELRDNHKFTNARSGQPQNWYTFASANSKVYKFGTSFTTGGKVRVEIYIDCGDKLKNEDLFDRIFLEKEKIQSQIRHELSWERLDNRRACRIAVYRDGDIDAETEVLNEIREWAIQQLLKFKEVFPAFVQQALG